MLRAVSLLVGEGSLDVDCTSTIAMPERGDYSALPPGLANNSCLSNEDVSRVDIGQSWQGLDNGVFRFIKRG